MLLIASIFIFFFFNDTATTEIYTLSLHDALPIFLTSLIVLSRSFAAVENLRCRRAVRASGTRQSSAIRARSEEHTSELQSQSNLVCRLLLEKKKNNYSGDESLGPICTDFVTHLPT